VRQILRAVGRRLHAEGHLINPRDIFLLEVDEIIEFIAGAASTSDLKPLVALRQTEFASYQATPPPPNRFTTHGLGHGSAFAEVALPISEVAEGQRRKGIGCCPGIVRGRVRRIVNPHQAVIHQGEILVAERTDPGWILLFPAAAGLLVERGSLLSHSAIVARELRLPAIVSIEGLMSWLKDGDEVEFDGSTGVVQRIKRTNTTTAGVGSSILPSPAKILSINTSVEKAAMFAT
jgi:pyruvate,water dikinase